MFNDLVVLKTHLKFNTDLEFKEFLDLCLAEDDSKPVSDESDIKYFTLSQRQRLRELLRNSFIDSNSVFREIELDGAAYMEASETLLDSFATYLKDHTIFVVTKVYGCWMYALYQGLETLRVYVRGKSDVSPAHGQAYQLSHAGRNVPWAYPVKAMKYINSALPVIMLGTAQSVGSKSDLLDMAIKAAWSAYHSDYIEVQWKTSSLFTPKIKLVELDKRTPLAQFFLINNSRGNKVPGWEFFGGLPHTPLFKPSGIPAEGIISQFTSGYVVLKDRTHTE